MRQAPRPHCWPGTSTARRCTCQAFLAMHPSMLHTCRQPHSCTRQHHWQGPVALPSRAHFCQRTSSNLSRHRTHCEQCRSGSSFSYLPSRQPSGTTTQHTPPLTAPATTRQQPTHPQGRTPQTAAPKHSSSCPPQAALPSPSSHHVHRAPGWLLHTAPCARASASSGTPHCSTAPGCT